MRSVPLSVVRLALICLAGIALIHLVDAPDSLSELPYKGILFLLSAAGAIVAAVGIWRAEIWGWHLGLLVAAGTFIGYVISRTVGLPGSGEVEMWLEPLGALSLLFEGGFLLLYGWALGKSTTLRPLKRV